MAGILDPFNPGADATPMAGVDPGTYDKVRSEWDSFLGNPQGRAALLSMGIALMQPPSFGDTPASQIGRAIGAGGASATANQAMDLKESEAQSKDDLRQARAESAMQNAETRAIAAEARTGAAGARSETALARLQHAQEASKLRAAIQLSGQYQNYSRSVAERNRKGQSDPLQMGKFVPEPTLSYPDWVKQNPMLKNLGLDAGGAGTTPTEDDTLVPPGADTTSQPALPTAKPNDPNRAPGRYMTPKGPMTWNGTGWVP